ncbi:KPN_02809 family neutral zinc metallopeptidase [Stakelama marina]|uniref:Neutral zinc metallopeptidase n=1 Tax=Stakelama marina TaxID=2826939 RepID=A0A8T4IKG3_9SPHN|nr:neutral zinc metallopeptidase [Stakelama marina]MBR0553595.1 neutral zinc metallopeptidase [Stakelama marina]
MRLDDLDPTRNARDLGSGGGGGGGFPLLGLLPLLLGRRMGCGGIALLVIIGVAYMALSGGGGMLGSTGGKVGYGGQQQSSANRPCDTQAELFACRVMTSTDDTWDSIFRSEGLRYTPATINFYRGGAQSGCGAAQSAMGPFYCPADDGVYLDTSFFDELKQRYGASGDFAQAYVIAHEMGHHVQDLLGTSADVQRQQAQLGRTAGNKLSVMLELQADCYAGVWGAKNRDRLEPGDVEEGMTAANAIGDDTLQREAQGRVVPDSFTHGTSQQRMHWLRVGLQTGDPARCDTFSGV